MTTGGSSPEREEITVRFADGALDRMDETCRTNGFATRSEFVTEAIARAVEQRG